MARYTKKMLKDQFLKNIRTLSSKNSFFSKTLIVIYLSINNFIKNKSTSIAASLTYYSLLSIVPFFALIFGIGKILGFHKYIQKDLLERFSEQQELMKEIIIFANNLINETKGGIIAIFGVLVFALAFIKVISHIETVLNSLWKVNKRKVRNSFALHLSLFIIIPIFLVFFSIVKFYLIKFSENKLFIDTLLSKAFYVLLIFSPYILLTAIFTFLFFYVPNIKIHFRSCFIAGIVSAVIFQIVQRFYIILQVGFTKYNAIYGSFAALPLFLIWLQICWLIFIYGAEISYAIEKK